MRVLFLMNLFPPGYTGGAEIINYHTCRGLIRRGVDCSILVVNNRTAKSADEYYEHGGIPVHRIGFYTRKRRALTDVFDWRIFRAALAELRRQKPDLVHIHNVSGASLAPYVACRIAGVPVINTLHDLWLLCPNNMLYRADGSFCDPAQNAGGCRDCFRRYDFWGDIPNRRSIFSALTSNVKYFIAPSQAMIRLHAAGGYEVERFRLVRHGLDGGAEKMIHQLVLQEIAGSSSLYHTLVFAGGGTEIKGAKVLLKALPLILRYVDRLRVIVTGRGEEQLLSRFRQYAPAVLVLGWVPFHEIHHLFAVADLVAVPSTCPEAFSLVTLGSLQVGTPVVGSDFGGIPELIEESKTGYLVPVGDHLALAERIIHHFARPAYVRRRMRHQCVQAVRDSLTFENHIQDILQVYEEVLVG
jgi:glycosyltransferase involved in cell wall biosynthesis